MALVPRALREFAGRQGKGLNRETCMYPVGKEEPLFQDRLPALGSAPGLTLPTFLDQSLLWVEMPGLTLRLKG